MNILDDAFKDIVSFTVVCYTRLREYSKRNDNLVEAKLNEPNDWGKIELLVQTGFGALMNQKEILLHSFVNSGLRTSIDMVDLFMFSNMIREFIIDEPELAPENWKG